MFLLRLKYIIPLALISGLVASYGVYVYLQQQQERIKAPEIATRQVVVAATALSLGTTLRAENLQIKEWPENLVPEGSFQEATELEGRVIKSEVSAGEPILNAKLAPAGSNGGFPSLIPPGMRAMTVAVNMVSGVGGFILPKTKVDVLLTVTPSSEKLETISKMILQNVEVLAVDQTYVKTDSDPSDVKSVTLLVTPEEAEKLALTGNEGKLQLTLRNTTDTAIAYTAGISLKQLLNHAEAKPRDQASRPKPAPASAAPAPKAEEPASSRVVEVIRANVRSEITFDEEKDAKKKPPKP
jgi:pilus assembly protein CpaB